MRSAKAPFSSGSICELTDLDTLDPAAFAGLLDPLALLGLAIPLVWRRMVVVEVGFLHGV